MTIIELANKIKTSQTWDGEDLKKLCYAAGMAEEWEAADGDAFEVVAFEAAERLGVEIV